MPEIGSQVRLPKFDYDRLSDYLKALGNPNRLELLYQLRFPRMTTEVHLTPKRTEPGGNPDRAISRQAVERHVGLLEEVGLVMAQRASRDGRSVDEYVVNQAMIFYVVEELRKLCLIRSVADVDPLATQGAEPVVSVKPKIEGPRMVLVGGVSEGKVYPLPAPSNADAEWVIGRREGVHIRLDYDPFISQDNSRIRLIKGRYYVEDDVRSRNGTLLNYEPLPRGSLAPLETGDLVGVGRSILLFRGT